MVSRLRNEKLCLQVANLLRREPQGLDFEVFTAPSAAGKEAGLGVFIRSLSCSAARQFSTRNGFPERNKGGSAMAVAAGHPIALYPGTVFPPPPSPLLFDEDPCTLVKFEPSGCNAYILNLEEGGFIDGEPAKRPDFPGRANPFAQGHLINHPNAAKSNVSPVSFLWHRVLAQQKSYKNTQAEDLYPIPNVRHSGFWFMDSRSREQVHLPDCDEATAISQGMRGVALVSNRPIFNHEELLMDYNLNTPLPWWAEGWYKPALGAQNKNTPWFW
mmetsp:Transcript_23525/g.46349  ORF Transcript_23525/g.46349 Transcript_23525/m.46349 type:complete len:272 (+) Transcript_23525:97-912(+)|eukprot:CAMPEP_0175164374 /NCGR_PEP_ID=MMETSP0087-20121206/26371_1 /TAXON_ID=136419 /ORGANISM="Unknown Unknown, Strain D1" /LENGTH=271 /DNA_ID=CAMNT_0016453385 /DNA_START=109 /DNA_END=924 /DNA_ORIENTATION=-